MKNESLIPFNFNENEIRALLVEGEPWFVASDVCSALNVVNNRDALSRLDDEEKGVGLTDMNGFSRNSAIINESGLYSLVLSSRKPEAKQFKKWVTSEVLPSIRKTGSYQPQNIDPSSLTRLDILQMAIESEQKAIELQSQLDIATPKALMLDELSQDTDNDYTVTQAAKILNIKPHAFGQLLRDNNILYYSPGSRSSLPYQKAVDAGWMKVKFVEGRNGVGMYPQSIITAKGITYIQKSFGTNGGEK